MIKAHMWPCCCLIKSSCPDLRDSTVPVIWHHRRIPGSRDRADPTPAPRELPPSVFPLLLLLFFIPIPSNLGLLVWQETNRSIKSLGFAFKDKNVFKWTENGFKILKAGRLALFLSIVFLNTRRSHQLWMQLVTAGRKHREAGEIRYYQPIIIFITASSSLPPLRPECRSSLFHSLS